MGGAPSRGARRLAVGLAVGGCRARRGRRATGTIRARSDARPLENDVVRRDKVLRLPRAERLASPPAARAIRVDGGERRAPDAQRVAPRGSACRLEAGGRRRRAAAGPFDSAARAREPPRVSRSWRSTLARLRGVETLRRLSLLPSVARWPSPSRERQRIATTLGGLTAARASIGSPAAERLRARRRASARRRRRRARVAAGRRRTRRADLGRAARVARGDLSHDRPATRAIVRSRRRASTSRKPRGLLRPACALLSAIGARGVRRDDGEAVSRITATRVRGGRARSAAGARPSRAAASRRDRVACTVSSRRSRRGWSAWMTPRDARHARPSSVHVRTASFVSGARAFGSERSRDACVCDRGAASRRFAARPRLVCARALDAGVPSERTAEPSGTGVTRHTRRRTADHARPQPDAAARSLPRSSPRRLGDRREEEQSRRSSRARRPRPGRGRGVRRAAAAIRCRPAPPSLRRPRRRRVAFTRVLRRWVAGIVPSDAIARSRLPPDVLLRRARRHPRRAPPRRRARRVGWRSPADVAGGAHLRASLRRLRRRLRVDRAVPVRARAARRRVARARATARKYQVASVQEERRRCERWRASTSLFESAVAASAFEDGGAVGGPAPRRGERAARLRGRPAARSTRRAFASRSRRGRAPPPRATARRRVDRYGATAMRIASGRTSIASGRRRESAFGSRATGSASTATRRLAESWRLA